MGHGSYQRFPYDRILKAVLRLKKEGYEVMLNAYVSELGYVNYTEFIEGFKRVINRFSLEGFAKVHLGNLSEAEKWRTICENNVVLFPSLVATAVDPPLIILEAMCMGKCVIATSIQSIPYLLREGRGIIIDKRNLEDKLYEVLKKLIDDPVLLKDAV